jgi:transmembrane sensor
MDKKTLINYINNRCTPEELENVMNWLIHSSDATENQLFLKDIMEDVISKEDGIRMDQDRILDKIHHTLNINQAREALLDESIGIQKNMPFQSIIRFLTRAAAILFLPLLLYTMYNFFSVKGYSLKQTAQIKQQYNEIMAPMGSVVSMDLPDGSKVWLNNGSKLRFPAKFVGSRRAVELEGEAYFEVNSNPRKPFIVNTKKIQVVALGTKFNLMAYNDDPVVETSLKEGKVLVRKIDEADTGHTLRELKPNEHITFNIQSEEYIIQKRDPEEFISWTNGKLIFKNVLLDQVARKLSRWYNVEFEIKGDNLKQYSYTATLIDETLPQVLELMKIATPIDYSISNRIEQEDGIYTRKKVTIWKRINF